MMRFTIISLRCGSQLILLKQVIPIVCVTGSTGRPMSLFQRLLLVASRLGWVTGVSPANLVRKEYANSWSSFWEDHWLIFLLGLNLSPPFGRLAARFPISSLKRFPTELLDIRGVGSSWPVPAMIQSTCGFI